jgi:hypothetical protein
MVSRTLDSVWRRRLNPSLPAIAGLLLVLLGPAAYAELDLSPWLEPYELEGVKMSQLTFNTGTNTKATYQPPRDWKYSGGKDQLDLQAPGLAQAMAKVTKWSPASAIAFDVEGRRQLTERMIGSLPKGSENVKVKSEELNPLQISGKQTYLVELTYTYYGEKFASYSLILERKPEVICFRLSCRESDYQALRNTFQKSLYTWQNL